MIAFVGHEVLELDTDFSEITIELVDLHDKFGALLLLLRPLDDDFIREYSTIGKVLLRDLREIRLLAVYCMSVHMLRVNCYVHFECFNTIPRAGWRGFGAAYTH